MIAPSRRALFFFALTPFLALAAITFAPEYWTAGPALAGLLLAGLLIELLATPRQRSIQIDLDLPGAIVVGTATPGTIALSVARSRRRIRFEALVEPDPPLSEIAPEALVCPPGGQAVLTVPLLGGRRGSAAGLRLWLRWRGPLGLMDRTASFTLAGPIRVTPNLPAVLSHALSIAVLDTIGTGRLDRRIGEGSEFHGLREHVAGLDPRWIDWKQSARHRKLLSKEFRVERSQNVVIGLDHGRLMGEQIGDLARLDQAVNACLLLGYQVAVSEDLLGLATYAGRFDRFLAPRAGLAAYRSMQAALSEIEYGTDETNHALALTEIGARLRRRSLIVVITEFVDPISAELMLEVLALLARRHLVLFVTLRDGELDRLAEARPDDLEDVARAVVSRDMRRDRDVVLERVRRLGAEVLEARPEELGPKLIGRYLDIRRRELI